MTLVRETVIWIQNDRNRRIAYLLLAILAAVLVYFPRPYVARAKLLPQDSSSAGLGQVVNALGGQLQSIATLLAGGRAPNDLYLIVGRSDSVLNDVIADLKLVGDGRPYRSLARAKLDLEDKVDVRLLLGGVVEIETRSRDARESEVLADAYLRAISARIGRLGRETIKRKNEIVRERLETAASRVTVTESRLDVFRRQNRLADPETQLGTEIALRANLQTQLQAKQVELQSLSQTSGPENPSLIAVQSEIANLRAQIGRTVQPTLTNAGPNVTGLSQLSNRYLNLYRDYRLAQALYEVYSRASEQAEVEQLVADSASYIQIIEPAHLDPDRKFNLWAVGLLGALVVLVLFTEWYAPATGLFRRRRRVKHEADVELA